MKTPQTAEQIARTIEVFGLKNPKAAVITKDVKTKLGLAFAKGDAVTVYEGGLIESGPYTGRMSYSVWSVRNDVLTAIRPNYFKAVGA